jgi:NAD(P)-dependent dehydrogenase (short-subunit alcohol dehydrogenase family)
VPRLIPATLLFPTFCCARAPAPNPDCCSNPDRPSRIVNVSSAAHYFGSIDFSDLQSSKSYQPWKAYGQAKLANVLHTYELARQLAPTANCTGMATPLGTTLPCPPVGVQSDQPPSAHRFSP